MPAEELIFPASPGFGPYKSIMPPEAVAHPAKFNVYLVEFLIDKYTKPGDTVLDPMAGTGVLGVIAALRGRNAIQVEIEPRFYEWMEKARQNVEKIPTLGRKGWIINILGDARRLSELLNQVDAIMTSPPYADSLTHEHDELRETRLVLRKSGENRGKPIALGRSQVHTIYSTSNNNIGNLPLGDIDAVITSPPYANTISHKAGGPVGVKKVGVSTITARTYSTSNDNIGNLPLGNVDVIITSPPYAHESTASKPTKLELEGKFKMGHSKEVPYTDDDYRSWDKRFGGNIGKLKMFVRVPASPEEADYIDKRPERKGTLWEYPKEVLVTPENVTQIQGSKRPDRGRGETYVEAMMKVYNEMYKVLKPNGYAIVVIKPFIRNKQVIDLPYYTWLLMERAGFKLEKLYKFRLPTKSFWRILYYKKHPEVPEIAHEYVIVAIKL
jgi:DNA modification methylase